MRRFPMLCLLVASCLLMAAGPPEKTTETDSRATTKAPPGASDEAVPATPPVLLPATPSENPGQSTPLAATAAISEQGQEIRAALDREREQLDALEDELDAATSEAAALSLLEQIRDVKRQAEREIYRIQARHARAAGKEELAAKIEAALERMDVPSPRPTPQPRRAHDAAEGH